MNHPHPDDYIDIHTHDSKASAGIFAIENLMAHEGRLPSDIPERTCTYGIHPWFLNEQNEVPLIGSVRAVASHENLIALGEAGFDKLRGPAMDLQTRTFETQVSISEEVGKPLYIHCVRAWNELLPSQKRMKPRMPWLIHGFRGNPDLAGQLISKGMYLSFWFEFVMRPESARLLRSVPRERIFLETDGAGIEISVIYKKVASDLGMDVCELKNIIFSNFNRFFNTGK
jgi:TatD DNase family protein